MSDTAFFTGAPETGQAASGLAMIRRLQTPQKADARPWETVKHKRDVACPECGTVYKNTRREFCPKCDRYF